MKIHLLFLLLTSSLGWPLRLDAQAEKKPTVISDAERQTLQSGWEKLRTEIGAAERAVAGQPALNALLPDVQVCAKTLDWSLHFDRPPAAKDLALLNQVLQLGLERAAELQSGRAPWTEQTGKVLRGFRSRLDDSVQPYVIRVPASWKHGDPQSRPLFLECPHAGLVTELAVIDAGFNQGNGFADEESFHLRAYARGYNAAKFAGEVNIFEALEHARTHYPIDARRLVLHGFSMGGSCAWHLAAHHPDAWAAASPGAGFADTEHFVKIWEWKRQPPPWHFTLFHYYNATDVAGNLAMVPTFAYVGEKDGHRFSHDAMAAACARDGVPLRRVLGLNAGHNYEKAARAEIEAWLAPIVAAGRPPFHSEVRYSTWGLRYDRCEWIRLNQLDEHWKRADIRARLEAPDFIRVNTANVNAFTIEPATLGSALASNQPIHLNIDGQSLQAPTAPTPSPITVHKSLKSWAPENGKPRAPTEVWELGLPASDGLHKEHGLTGPIDDAFMERFLFVRPTGTALNEKVGVWVSAELEHAQQMWRKIYRGDVRIKDDRDVTESDIAESNLILWGDPESNTLIARVLPKLPLEWSTKKLVLAGKSYDAATHAPILLYPNPLNPQRYIVLNSGTTQREAHIGTSALTTPKLPDFAIINLDTPPDHDAPGNVVQAGFFNESWKPSITE